jgi:hypothetical protein
MWSLFVALSITTLSYYSQYYNAECYISFIVMLSVVILMLCVMFEGPYLGENEKKSQVKHSQK